jgi:hypothetical protein
MCHHVLNRGNGRAEVFHKAGDYAAFLDLIAVLKSAGGGVPHKSAGRYRPAKL